MSLILLMASGTNQFRPGSTSAASGSPQALADYYSLLGYNRIAAQQKRLRTIEELDWSENWLVFMDDDLGICSWGIHRRELDSLDPVVWQGLHGEHMDWAPETSTVSQFLVEMWREIV